jgi:hypothetical protein
MTFGQFMLDYIGNHRSVTFGELKQAGSEANSAKQTSPAGCPMQ